MKKIKLLISMDYLIREFDQHDRDVLSWLWEYSRRNKIESHVVTEIGKPEAGGQFAMLFKSDNQRQCFLRIANKTWQYFEFI